MNLRDIWTARYAKEGRPRRNIFDPEMFTNEEQVQMFGSILTSEPRGENKKKKLSYTEKMMEKLSELSYEEQKDVLRQLRNEL